jgi:hypothetical protein
MLKNARLSMPTDLSPSLKNSTATFESALYPMSENKKKLKKHVKAIQPKILADFSLVLSPRNDDFQAPEEQ